ncbi:hypothetical protein J4209_06195 [Candidatus Woesearchaeota archaeon]|nr:hypothetical protein [Candidatus Woesearchaeota archaeon]
MTEEGKTSQIRFRTIIEMLGKPKEHVEKTLSLYIDKIKEDGNIIVLNEDYAELKQQENMWSTFVELEIVVKDISILIGFCIDYMPSSVEIVKPEQLAFNNRELSNFLNDLQAKLHNLDMIVKQLKAQNDFLKRNMNVSLKNTVSIMLSIKGALSLKELAKLSGINEKEAGALLNGMIKEERIKKEEDKYILILKKNVKEQN